MGSDRNDQRWALGGLHQESGIVSSLTLAKDFDHPVAGDVCGQWSQSHVVAAFSASKL